MTSDWFTPDLHPERFRRLGYQAIDMIADYHHRLPDLPVSPDITGSEAARRFADPLPEDGEDPETILADWVDRILPAATHVGSPRYFGFVMGSGSQMAVVAEALAASVNMNAGGWKAGPAATEIERRCIRWLAELIGYDSDCGGILTSGGTMANVTALATALRWAAGFDLSEDGLQAAGTGRFRLYMADHEGHVSILRAASLLGLGRSAVRAVPSTDDFTMDVGALDAMIGEDLADGDRPFCVVAQVGSVNTGSIDPLDDIADVCADRGLWFHADGASGAVGAMLPELSDRYRGLDRADSITLDPHKWLFMPYECGSLLVHDGRELNDAFSMTAPYLRGTTPNEYEGLDYFEHGPQMSRGFRALKLWMTIRHYGASGYRRLLRQGIACARLLHELVESADDFEALHEPILFLYSFRFTPPTPDGRDREEALDQLNQDLADAIQLDGTAFLTTTTIGSRVVLRVSIASHRTTPADIRATFDRLTQIGAELAGRSTARRA